jgi:CheY-like chemotaxis protein
MVHNACSIVASTSKQRGLTLEVSVDGPVPEGVIGDEDRTRQVLLNLLNNAVKFTPSGSVKLTVTAEGGKGGQLEIRYTVSDTGVGIPADRIGRLFQRFSQVDSSVKREFGGSGLGLAICKQLVELMGGRIGVFSEIGLGSSFWFVVPYEEAPAVEQAPETGSHRAAAPQGAFILLAEDNAINQDIARSMLNAMGHTVFIAKNGAEAVSAVMASRFDMILMDVQMPVMDGLEATARIRATEDPTCRTPIIAMTANVLPQQVEAFLGAGMDDHVGKPFRREHLASVIDRWCGRSSRLHVRVSVAAE